MKRIEILIDRVDGEAVTMETRSWAVRVMRNGEACEGIGAGWDAQILITIGALTRANIIGAARRLRKLPTRSERIAREELKNQNDRRERELRYAVTLRSTAPAHWWQRLRAWWSAPWVDDGGPNAGGAGHFC